MKDGRETGSLEEHRNGEPYALKGARTVRKGPERKGLITVPRSQATLLSSSANALIFGPTMQIQRHHIPGGTRALGKLRQEQLVNHPRTGDPTPPLGSLGPLGR